MGRTGGPTLRMNTKPKAKERLSYQVKVCQRIWVIVREKAQDLLVMRKMWIQQCCQLQSRVTYLETPTVMKKQRMEVIISLTKWRIDYLWTKNDIPMLHLMKMRHMSVKQNMLSLSSRMATFSISNVIGVDPKPFDPSTYVEENYYVTDTSGSKRHLPSANIIRWRQVSGPGGKISLESNARFVTWSDGSLQLLIGNESFDVSEQAVEDIQSHLFVKLKHEKGIYQAQGRITRKMRFMPASLSSSSHEVLTAIVNSQNQKGSKVKQYVTGVDPEFLAEEQMRAEKQIMKADRQLKGKKKKTSKKYKAKGHKGKGLAPEYLEDAINKNHYEPELCDSLHHFELDQEKEAAAEKRLLIAKKGPNDPLREMPELKDGLKGGMAEGSIPHGMIKEVQEEREQIFEDSEDDASEPKAEGKKTRSGLKKYIESDEESPARRIATRRHMAIVYDSSEE